MVETLQAAAVVEAPQGLPQKIYVDRPVIQEKVVIQTVDNPEHIKRLNSLAEQVNGLLPLVEELKKQRVNDKETIERLEQEVEHYKSKLTIVTLESENTAKLELKAFKAQAEKLFEVIYEDINVTNSLCRQDRPYYNIFAPFDAFCKKYQDVQRNSRG